MILPGREPAPLPEGGHPASRAASDLIPNAEDPDQQAHSRGQTAGTTPSKVKKKPNIY